MLKPVCAPKPQAGIPIGKAAYPNPAFSHNGVHVAVGKVDIREALLQHPVHHFQITTGEMVDTAGIADGAAGEKRQKGSRDHRLQDL